MGALLSSEPVKPLLPNTICSSSSQNHNVSVASSIMRYKPPQQAFDIFERPPSSLDTVYEHEKEREEVHDHPMEQRMNAEGEASMPNEILDSRETKETIYYKQTLEQIQGSSNEEFYDLRRIGVKPVMVTDDIILRRQRSMRPNIAPKPDRDS